MSLPFDPTLEGFHYRRQKACCLIFDDGEFELVINKTGKFVKMTKLGKNRQLQDGAWVPKYQDTFKEKLNGIRSENTSK